MGRTEGKNGSFMAIRMRIHQNLSSSMTPLLLRSQLLEVFIISSDFDLAQHFSCSVKSVECGQIFLLACRQLRKKAQHNFIGQFYVVMMNEVSNRLNPPNPRPPPPRALGSATDTSCTYYIMLSQNHTWPSRLLSTHRPSDLA